MLWRKRNAQTHSELPDQKEIGDKTLAEKIEEIDRVCSMCKPADISPYQNLGKGPFLEAEPAYLAEVLTHVGVKGKKTY